MCPSCLNQKKTSSIQSKNIRHQNKLYLKQVCIHWWKQWLYNIPCMCHMICHWTVPISPLMSQLRCYLWGGQLVMRRVVLRMRSPGETASSTAQHHSCTPAHRHTELINRKRAAKYNFELLTYRHPSTHLPRGGQWSWVGTGTSPWL